MNNIKEFFKDLCKNQNEIVDNYTSFQKAKISEGRQINIDQRRKIDKANQTLKYYQRLLEIDKTPFFTSALDVMLDDLQKELLEKKDLLDFYSVEQKVLVPSVSKSINKIEESIEKINDLLNEIQLDKQN